MTQDSCALFFAGCEVRKWARLTQEIGVEHVAINYRYLRERTKVDRFSVEKHFPPEQEVWLDPGAFGINQEKWDQAALEDFLLEYISFAETNVGALTYVTELDASALGWDWISQRRNDSYGSIPRDKLVVVWHPEWGITGLQSMVRSYPNVAVPTLERGSAARVHGVSRSVGQQLMGLRMDHPFELPGGVYKAVLSSSWISPAKYGETHVWDHSRMRRYPSSQKVIARKRHANDFKLAGFDPEKIANDDPTELPKYTIWAWQQLEGSLARRRLNPTKATNGKVATISSVQTIQQNADVDMTRVDTLLAEGAELLSTIHENGKSHLPALVEPPVIPGFGWRPVKVQVPDPENEGELVEVIQRVPVVATESVRKCDTCSLQNNCPGFDPGASCRYSMPVEIRSRDQLMGCLTTLLEMQFQRIAFGRFAEDVEGGYPNPNLTTEIGFFYKLVTVLKEISDNRDTLNLQIKSSNLGQGTGILRRIFGAGATEPLRQVDPEAAEEALRRTFSG